MIETAHWSGSYLTVVVDMVKLAPAPILEPISGEVKMLRGRAYRGSCEPLATALEPISGETDVVRQGIQDI